MDISTTSQTALSAQNQQDSVAPRQAPQLDTASWVALVAFVAYIGVGLLA